MNKKKLKKNKEMGNIIAGALVGVFIYMTDMVLRQFIVTGGIFELIKFVLQGILTYEFVMIVDNFSKS